MNSTFYRVGRLRNGEQVGKPIEVDYFLDATEQIEDWMEAHEYEIVEQAPEGFNANYHTVPQEDWDASWVEHNNRIQSLYDCEQRLWNKKWEASHPAVPNAQHIITAGTETYWIEKVEEEAKAS